jgi:transcription elongation factor Elf1
MKPMAKRSVVAALLKHGCCKVSEQGIHEKWACPSECGQHSTAVPRHNEISPGVVRKIQRRMACLPAGRVAAVTTSAPTKPTAYTAVCKRIGNWWEITVPELDEVTQARRLDDVAATVADLVAVITDTDPAAVEVNVQAHQGPGLGLARVGRLALVATALVIAWRMIREAIALGG